LVAFSQNPPSVRFISAQLFNGVGDYDRIGGAGNVYTFAVGDFNNDGKLDFVATSNGTTAQGLGLVLGNGNGSFQAPLLIADFGGFASMGGVAAGDFNKDGNLDFAAVWAVGGKVQIGVYLGDGQAHFTPDKQYTIGATVPRTLVSVDLDGDGNLDVVAPDPANSAVVVLYGKGDGTFQNPVDYYTGATAATGVAVGDFNKDGKPDLVVASSTGCCPFSGGISVLLNSGEEMFQSPVLYLNPGGVDAGQVAVADLNGDGKLDVVESSMGGQNLAMFLGNGDGTFQASSNYYVPWPSTVAIGDLNGDKKPDLVTPCYYDGTVWVLLNRGNGVFQVSGVYSSDWSAMSLTLADFNGDKRLDFATGNTNAGLVTVGLGNGDGSFRSGAHYNESGSPGYTNGFAVADFNLDGNPDVVQAGGGTGVGLNIMLGTSHGVLKPPTEINIGGTGNSPVMFVLAGDVNGDGKPDLVSSTAEGYGNPYGVLVWLGTGTGKFRTPVVYTSSASSYPATAQLADVNGDRKLDILTSNYDGTFSVLLNQGKGVYGSPIVIPSGTGSYPTNFAVGDFNSDGKLDVVLNDFPGHNLNLLFGSGDGTFQPPVVMYSVLRPYAPIVGDFNKDGKLDLAIPGYDYGGSLVILRGSGNGTFSQPNTIYYFYPQDLNHSGQFIPNSGVAVDLNGDGNLDIALAPTVPSYFVCGGYRCAEQYMGALVFLGKGNGAFVQRSGWLAGVSPAYVAAADFNRDGMPDLAFLSNNLNYGETSLTILQNAIQPVSVSPLSLAYPTQYIGTSESQTVILTNDQGGKLTISSIQLSGANASDFSSKSSCGSSLAAGLHCTITVNFIPAGLGLRTASLLINDSVGTQSAALSGVSTEVTLNPTSLRFGSVTVGQTGTQEVQLTNIGSSAMSFTGSGITITGAASGDYSQINTCGTSVGASQSCTITVTFKPLTTGTRSATLSISDNGGASPQNVPLRGTGT